MRRQFTGGPLLRASFFALIMLTQPGGNVVWVDVGHLAIIKTHCQGGPGSVISVGGKELCVRETPDQIREKIRDADRH